MKHIITIIFGFSVLGQAIYGSGIDDDANFKEVKITTSEGFSVTASIGEEGELSKMEIKTKDNKSLLLKENDLVDIPNVDLQTLEMRVATNAGKEIDDFFTISISYGEIDTWNIETKEDGNVKLIIRPCVEFLFANGRLVSRHRAVPSDSKYEWKMFSKKSGEEEHYDGVEKSRDCPISAYAKIQANHGFKKEDK